MRIGLFCELTMRPEYVDEFLPLMQEHSTACPQEEEGCLAFRVGRDRDDPYMIRIYEEYRSWDDRLLHASTERYDTFNAKIDHMLSKVVVYEVNLHW